MNALQVAEKKLGQKKEKMESPKPMKKMVYTLQ
jgi:hypothetical protein